MIDALNLIWLIPVCCAAGFLLAALLTVNDR